MRVVGDAGGVSAAGLGPRVTGERVLHTVAVDKYICTDCGCVEQWVNSEADLARLKEAIGNAH